MAAGHGLRAPGVRTHLPRRRQPEACRAFGLALEVGADWSVAVDRIALALRANPAQGCLRGNLSSTRSSRARTRASCVEVERPMPKPLATSVIWPR